MRKDIILQKIEIICLVDLDDSSSLKGYSPAIIVNPNIALNMKLRKIKRFMYNFRKTITTSMTYAKLLEKKILKSYIIDNTQIKFKLVSSNAYYVYLELITPIDIKAYVRIDSTDFNRLILETPYVLNGLLPSDYCIECFDDDLDSSLSVSPIKEDPYDSRLQIAKNIGKVISDPSKITKNFEPGHLYYTKNNQFIIFLGKLNNTCICSWKLSSLNKTTFDIYSTNIFARGQYKLNISNHILYIEVNSNAIDVYLNNAGKYNLSDLFTNLFDYKVSSIKYSIPFMKDVGSGDYRNFLYAKRLSKTGSHGLSGWDLAEIFTDNISSSSSINNYVKLLCRTAMEKTKNTVFTGKGDELLLGDEVNYLPYMFDINYVQNNMKDLYVQYLINACSFIIGRIKSCKDLVEFKKHMNSNYLYLCNYISNATNNFPFTLDEESLNKIYEELYNRQKKFIETLTAKP